MLGKNTQRLIIGAGLFLVVMVFLGLVLIRRETNTKQTSKESAFPFLKIQTLGWGKMNSLPVGTPVHGISQVRCELSGRRYITAFISGDFKPAPSSWRIGDEIYILALYDKDDQLIYFVSRHRPS